MSAHLSNDSLSHRISVRYGRKKGLFQHCLQLARYELGILSKYEKVDWNRVQRLAFVCKGNICRSAYAEARAKFLGVSSISLGLETVSRRPADEMAIFVAGRRGLDLTTHMTRCSSDVCIQSGDLVLAMEEKHANRIASILTPGVQLSLLGLWSTPVVPHLQDPYGLSEEYFDTCFMLIDNAIRHISEKMPPGYRIAHSK
jgi:protein-tyrosine phosphatase